MEDIRVPDVWLQRIGFKLGNPFSTREASREPEPELLQYFVHHPRFDDIMGDALHPTSAFLVAERGCGKTTNRRAIEWNCRAGRPNGLILPIPYIEFSALMEYADENGKVTPDHHLGLIIKEATPLLLERLAQNPKIVDRFSLGFRKKLAEYLTRYTDLITDAGLDKWLLKIGIHSNKINAEVLRSKKYIKGNIFLRFLVELLGLAREQKDRSTASAIDQLTQFVSMTELAGFKAIYVLVDRIDEQEPMSSNPRYAANLLEPLVTNLHLLEFDKTAFKFFLTPAIMDIILKQPGFRRDRLMVRDINWNEAELRNMLDKRVEVFTQGTLPSLDAVSEPDLALVAQLASSANRSPRNMMRLAEWLLYWHHARTSEVNEFLISKEDLEKSVESFNHETKIFQSTVDEPLSTIRVDESHYVWRGSKKLKQLPALQRKLLEYLIEQKGKVCSYSALRHAVYNESSTDRLTDDGRIDQLIKRIRKVVEVDPSHPTLIIKVSEKGYVLEESKKTT